VRECLDPPRAAQRLGVCVATIYRLVESGALRGVRAGRALRIDAEVLEKFVADGGASRSAMRAARPMGGV